MALALMFLEVTGALTAVDWTRTRNIHFCPCVKTIFLIFFILRGPQKVTSIMSKKKGEICIKSATITRDNINATLLQLFAKEIVAVTVDSNDAIAKIGRLRKSIYVGQCVSGIPWYLEKDQGGVHNCKKLAWGVGDGTSVNN